MFKYLHLSFLGVISGKKTLKIFIVAKIAALSLLLNSCAKEGSSPDVTSSTESKGNENSRASDDVREKDEKANEDSDTPGSATICRYVPTKFSTLETSLSDPGYELVKTTGCKISLKHTDSNASSYYSCYSLNNETLENSSQTYFYESPSAFVNDANFLKAFKKEIISEENLRSVTIFVHDFNNYRLLSYRKFVDSADGFEEIATGLTNGWNVDLLPVEITESSVSCDKTITYEYNDDKLLVRFKESSSSNCVDAYSIEKLYEYDQKGLIKRSLEKTISNPGTDTASSSIKRINYSYEETEKICAQSAM